MYFDSVQALIAMDGHGGYVWSAYLITIAVITGLVVLPLRRRRQLLRQLAGEVKRTQGSPVATEENG